MKICKVGTALIRAYRRTEGRTYITKLTGALRYVLERT